VTWRFLSHELKVTKVFGRMSVQREPDQG